MDKDTRLRLAQQAQAFIGSDLYAHIRRSMVDDIVEGWKRCKLADEATQVRLKHLLHGVELFDTKLTGLLNDLKIEEAERAERAKRKRPA